ncbi:hypothetical protein NDU88_003115, partial [Pleurodeles waltl]
DCDGQEKWRGAGGAGAERGWTERAGPSCCTACRAGPRVRPGAAAMGESSEKVPIALAGPEDVEQCLP